MNDNFKDNVIESIQTSDVYWSEYQKNYDISTFEMVMDRFNIQNFLDNTNIDEYYYNKYFKKVIKKYDKSLHKEVKKEFKKYSQQKFSDFNFDFDRVVIFNSLINSDFIGHPYHSEKMISLLRYVFDKIDIENIYDDLQITKDDYKKYFKDVIKKYNPQTHKSIMDEYREKQK
jgi:hypothetical protein